jgi:hypothetical protein
MSTSGERLAGVSRFACRNLHDPSVDENDCAHPHADHRGPHHDLEERIAFDHALDGPDDADDDGQPPPVLT